MIVTVESVNIQLPDSPRTKGVHLSNIIKCIAQETGILKTELLESIELVDSAKDLDTIACLRISIGLAWEQFYIPQIKGVKDHPGEMKVEGVYMNPDGESVSVVMTESVTITSFPLAKRPLRLMRIIHEVKATYKSTKTVGMMETQWMWMAQLKAYCRAKSTRFGWMHVLFLCDDYSFPIKPTLKIFKIEFTQEELDDNWTFLQDYKKFKLEGGVVGN